MIRKMAFLFSIFFLLLLCTNPKRENPFDTNSENWFPPVVKGMGAVSVSINDSVMLTATASDKNGYIAGFLWALDGMSFNYKTSVGSIKTIFPTCGNFIVPVKAADNDGVVSTPDTIKITVTLNPPTVTAMLDCSVPLNDSITITAEGNDPNGYIVQYLWALNGLSYNDTTVTGALRTVFKDSGIFCVKVKVKDDDGLISLPDSVKITVVSNPPSVVMLTHDTLVPINDTLLVKATGTDPNGVIVKYLWRIDNNLHSDSTDSGSIKVAFMNSGMHTVKVKVRDDDGLFSQDASVKITVISYPPSVCILSFCPKTYLF